MSILSCFPGGGENLVLVEGSIPFPAGGYTGDLTVSGIKNILMIVVRQDYNSVVSHMWSRAKVDDAFAVVYNGNAYSLSGQSLVAKINSINGNVVNFTAQKYVDGGDGWAYYAGNFMYTVLGTA